MTAMLFESREGGYPDTYCRGHDADPARLPGAAGASEGLPNGASANDYATQTLRMKAFVGQRQFQAPVADDFARGMLTPGQVNRTTASSQWHIASALAALLASLGWQRTD